MDHSDDIDESAPQNIEMLNEVPQDSQDDDVDDLIGGAE